MKKQRFIVGLGTLIITAGLIAACSGSASAKLNLLFKDGPGNGVAGKVAGKDITEQELTSDVQFEIYDLEKKIFDIKKGALKKVLEQRLIGEEAAKAKLSTEEYIKKNVIKSEPKISDADIKKFAKDRGVPEANLNDQIKERVKQILGEQKKDELVEAYLAKLTKSNPVEVYFKKPTLNLKIDAAGSPWFGGEKSKVVVYEFSDFECPFCSRGATAVAALKKKYGSKIKIVFKHLPLPMHPNARPAAELSMCIADQSQDKFWKFHDVVFEKQKDGLGMDKLYAHAKTVGADEKKLKECFEAKKFAAAVDADMKLSDQIGIRSTPTFIINGQAISGAQGVEAFSEIIDEELSNG